MAQVINTNVQSLIAQRNLFRSGASLQTSIERLSSGLRINSARDDAAGLAISERMSSQLRGMEVAKRNANDGISALQVADGSLSSLGDNLQRMRELAVQASNGTLSASDRENLNLEFQQLSEELSRVAGDAEFNGVKLLQGDANGDPMQFELQIGATSSSQLQVSFENIDSEIDAFYTAREGALGTAQADAADVELGDLGVTSSAAATSDTLNDEVTIDIDGDGLNDFVAVGNGATVDIFELTPNDERGTEVSSGLAAGNVADLTLGDLGVASALATATEDGEELTLEVGNATVKLASDGLEFTDYRVTERLTGSTGAQAQGILDKIDTLLDTVNNQRAALGAGINRLDAVINNLETSIVNLGAARGRIVDADFARETANLTRTQILQQAGTAMLAQANQLPANVLSLLG